MNESESSGNRWEPGQASGTGPIRQGGASGVPAPSADGPDPAPAAEPTAAFAAAPASTARPGFRNRVERLRGSRAALATGAAGVLLAVGSAGFAAGWVASPDGNDGFPGPGGHRGFPSDVSGGPNGDGHGQFAPDGDGFGQGFPDDDGQPDGTQPSTPDSEGFSESSWYVVPAAPSGATL